MRNALLIVTILLCLSCSKDDDNNNPEVIKANKFVDRMMLTSNGNSNEIILDYNNSKEVTGYTRGSTTSLTYEYEQGRLTQINDTDLNNVPYQFNYTNELLSGLKHYDINYPVTYNSSENSYIFEGANFGIKVQGRDLVSINESNVTYTLTYSATNKGPMYNVSTPNPYLLPLFSESSYLFLSSMPISQITINDSGEKTLYNAEHTYDSEGYVISTVLRSGSIEFYRAEFHYVEL